MAFAMEFKPTIDASVSAALVDRLVDPAGAQPATAPSSSELFDSVYDEMRQLALTYLARQQAGNTLQATALVHEVYLRLCETRGQVWQDRSHFLAVAAIAMRQIMVNHVRDRAAAKRGGGWQRVTLADQLDGQDVSTVEVDLLYRAMDKLTALNARHGFVAAARFLGGLSVEETARILGMSERSVKADWHFARAWLARELDEAA